MDEFSEVEREELQEAGLSDQIDFRGEHLWIDGVHITSWDCPDCLYHNHGRCLGCSFFDPGTCRLRDDWELRHDLKVILGDYRERLFALRGRQERFVSALHTELQAHGRPLHYTVLAQMMADRHSTLQVTETKVLMTLVHHSEVFEKIDEGVYYLRSA